MNRDSIMEELNSEEVKLPTQIPVTLFRKRSNKTTKLINNGSENNFLKGRNSRFHFDLEEPIFISSISVKTSGYANYKSIDFNWSSINRAYEKSKTIDFHDGSSTVEIREIVNKFSIQPPKSMFSDPRIESVVVYGFTLIEFNEVCDIIPNIDKYKSSIISQCQSKIEESKNAESILEHFEENKENVALEISDLESEKSDIIKEISALKEKIEESSILLTEKKSQESDTKSRIENIEDAIDKKKKESQTLNTEISKNQEVLKRLKSDINMFPSEFQGFATQGGRNIRWYSFLAFLPMSLLVVYTLVLFNGAIDLTTIYQRHESIDLWSTFISRFPFVMISIFAIHSCYIISKLFIRELIRINQQRLNLSKISIIAKDIADTSTANLDFSDDEIYEIRTKLKMDLIKSHLKGYIDENYEYDMDINIWKKFLAKNRKNEEIKEDPVTNERE